MVQPSSPQAQLRVVSDDDGGAPSPPFRDEAALLESVADPEDFVPSALGETLVDPEDYEAAAEACAPAAEPEGEGKGGGKGKVIPIFVPQQRFDKFVVPFPYEMWRDGIYSRGADKSGNQPDSDVMPSVDLVPPASRRPFLKQISSGPVWFLRFGEDVRTDEERVEVATRNLRGRTVRMWVNVASLRSQQGLGINAERGIPVTSEHTPKLIRFLDRALNENSAQLPWVLVSHQPGAIQTHAGWGWMLGKQWIGPEGIEVIADHEGSEDLLRAFGPRGAEEQWMKTFRELLDTGPVQRWLVMSAFASALLRFIGKRTFIVHHWSPTGAGKSAIDRFSASVWGDGRKLAETFNATELALVERMSVSSDFVVTFDELQSTTVDIGSVIYRICLEQGRRRVQKTGGLNDMITWRTLVRTNGEEPIIGRGGGENLGGQSNRVIQIYGAPIPNALATKLHLSVESGEGGWAGYRFLRCLGAAVASNANPIEAVYKRFFDRLSAIEETSSLGERTSHIAVVGTADYFVRCWLLDEPWEKAAEGAWEDMMAVLDVVVADSQEDLKLADRVLQTIRDSVVSEPTKWLVSTRDESLRKLIDRQHDPIIGIVVPDRDEVWLVPDQATMLFRGRLDGIRPRVAWAALKEAGVLVPGDGKHLTMHRTWGDVRERVYVLSLQKLDCWVADW